MIKSHAFSTLMFSAMWRIYLALTDKGERIARAISYWHKIMTDFLQLMKVSPREVERDVEGMEHHLSTSSLEVIEALFKELSSNKELLDKINFAAKH